MTLDATSTTGSTGAEAELIEAVGPGVGPVQPGTTRSRAREIIEAIERPRTGAKRPENALPATKPAGFGEAYDECGEEPVPRFCADCGHVAHFTRTCYRATCPRCAASWCRRQATSIAAKLDALRRYRYASTPPSQVPKFHHLIFSVPDEWFLLAETLGRTFEMVGEMMDALGIQGVAFYHAHRGKDGDDRGAWKERLFSERPWQTEPPGDGVDAELEFSPHIHIIGVAVEVDVRVGEQVYEETGWVIKRIHDDNGVSVSDDFDLARKVSYCLSHTGLRETENGDTRACYRYLGADMNRVTADEAAEDRMDGIMRSVAPETLGIPYDDLACGNERTEKAENRVSTAAASASRMDIYADVGGASGEQGDGDEWDDGEVDLDRPERATTSDGLDGPEETTRCEGRLLNIMSAPKFLDDSEWRESAEHADTLAAEYADYVDEGVG